MNRAMLRKLNSGKCLDLSNCVRDSERYVLSEFREGVDYCDAVAGAWIWSIGQRKSDGVILASRTTELYQNPDFVCLFLR